MMNSIERKAQQVSVECTSAVKEADYRPTHGVLALLGSEEVKGDHIQITYTSHFR